MEGRVRESILIVDDDAILAELLGLFLRSKGYETVAADDVSAAVSIIQRQQLEALIADSLPGLDGLKVVRAFRDKNPSGAIIFFTGLAADDTSELATSAGANVVLFKPVGLDVVDSTLRQLLAKSACLPSG
jgi:DNA-binding response OmpR family regulator